MVNVNKQTKTKSNAKATCNFKIYSQVIVHKSRTQYITEQFRLFSLTTSRLSSQLRCCLLEIYWKRR